MKSASSSTIARLEVGQGWKLTGELGELIIRSDLCHVLYTNKSLPYYLRKEGVPRFLNGL